jgi:hypothetical protein
VSSPKKVSVPVQELLAMIREAQEREHEIIQELREPMEELEQVRELIKRTEAILELNSIPVPSHSQSQQGKNWKHMCQIHGWRVGGDSAHRVVLRHDRALHDSVPHLCPYDKVWYPAPIEKSDSNA